MKQTALPFSANRLADETRIVIGAANGAAMRGLQNPADWPYRTAVLIGPPRSGKTSFARWFAARNPDAAVLDDAHRRAEDDIFHAWNRAQENGNLLMIVGAADWQIALPDLRSRLGAAMRLGISGPDDRLVVALLEAHAEQRALALGKDALNYLSQRVERSFAGVERLVAAADRLSLERKTAPNRAIWREALEALQGPEQGRLF